MEILTMEKIVDAFIHKNLSAFITENQSKKKITHRNNQYFENKEV